MLPRPADSRKIDTAAVMLEELTDDRFPAPGRIHRQCLTTTALDQPFGGVDMSEPIRVTVNVTLH